MMHKFILIGIVAALVMVVVTGSVSAAVTFEKLTQLTTDPANEYNPAWSPDGNDLIFTI
jgi:tricorn protease-like protein